MSERFLIPETRRVHIREPQAHWVIPTYLCGIGTAHDDVWISTGKLPKGMRLCKRCARIAKNKEALNRETTDE